MSYYRKLVKILALFILASIFFLLSPRIHSLYAQTILLDENFDDGNANDNLPVDWNEINNSGTWDAHTGKYIGTVTSGGLGPLSLVGNNTWSNYSFEVKVKGLAGPDRHVLFRFDSGRTPAGYAIKYRENDFGFVGIQLQKAGVAVLQTNSTYVSNLGEEHLLKIEGLDNNIKVYVDNILLIDYLDTTPVLNGGVGFFVEPPGVGSINTTEYDDVLVKEISEQQSLDIPDLKQFDPIWGQKEYDTASTWSANPSIERWGCALTSSSMVLQYYGHNINPDSLNTWLVSQPDGYIRNGLVNWLAISRYTLQNASPNSTILEFSRTGANGSILDNELKDQKPAILKIPGHFVVVTGKDSSENFLVNDPASFDNTMLSEVEAEHGGNYVNTYIYSPTSTDLSYIMLVINPEFQLKILHPDGSEIINHFTLEEPLTDDVNNELVSGNSLKVFMFPKPEKGDYLVEVTGNGIYRLDSYLYGNTGNVVPTTIKGIVDSNQSDIFNVSINDTLEIKLDQSIALTIRKLDNAFSSGFISRSSLYRILKSLLRSAQRFNNRGYTKLTIRLLSRTNRYISRYTPRFINPNVSEILQSDINMLVENL